ncbi:conserved hypothetical protein [Stigmatella aurantiaca DW4/3-1]|uniref:Uncharacterized protein n=1 Tax=Stigmatella aurantiaca (strain DW4/3-1) TaxID=378806 RepID=Q090K0_STIAD|nr:conserved hypothetical protein [Stigmatella aurantiaca DW4/3-1]
MYPSDGTVCGRLLIKTLGVLEILEAQPVFLQQPVEALHGQTGALFGGLHVEAHLLHHLGEVEALEVGQHTVLGLVVVHPRDEGAHAGGRRALVLLGGLGHEVQPAGVARLLHERAALQHVAQLAHVAGPLIALEEGERLRGELEGGLQRVQQGLGEHGDVLAPGAQGGQAHAGHRQPEIQVGAEAALAHVLLQVAVGGGDDAHVHRHCAAIQRGHLAALQHAQQLGLKRQGQLSHFVQEEGSPLGGLEDATHALVPVIHRAHGAEQLALGLLLGDEVAVHDLEGAVTAGGVLVHGARGELLAGARLPLDEEVHVFAGDAAQVGEDQAHPLRGAHQRTEGVRPGGHLHLGGAHIRLDGEPCLAQLDLVAGLEQDLEHLPAVQVRAVAAAQILQQQPLGGALDFQVPAADGRIREDEIARRVRANAHQRVLGGELLALVRSRGHLDGPLAHLDADGAAFGFHLNGLGDFGLVGHGHSPSHARGGGQEPVRPGGALFTGVGTWGARQTHRHRTSRGPQWTGGRAPVGGRSLPFSLPGEAWNASPGGSPRASTSRTRRWRGRIPWTARRRRHPARCRPSSPARWWDSW